MILISTMSDSAFYSLSKYLFEVTPSDEIRLMSGIISLWLKDRVT